MDLFDTDPLVLPRPDGGAPPGVPLLLLQRADGTRRIVASAGRIDYHRTAAPPGAPIEFGSFFAEAAALFVDLRHEMRFRVGRLAAMVARYGEHPSPAMALAQHFCRAEVISGPLNRPEAFELHSHKRFKTSVGQEVNSWVRNKSAFLDATKAPIVVVEQDMNTLPELIETVDYTDDEIRAFFGQILHDLDRTLELYYPQDGRD